MSILTMTSICILPITDATGAQHYQARSGDKQSIGQTPGEALDAIVQALGQNEFNVFLPNFQPDIYFTAAQQQRLSTLMEAWRTARDREQNFPSDLQIELNALVEAELKASAQRLSSDLPNS